MASQGRKSKHPVRQYFSFDIDHNRNTCNIENCSKKNNTVTGDHAGNLLKHLERFHSNEAKKVKDLLKLQLEKRSDDCVPVYFTKKEIVDALVEITTVNARPYKIVTDSGMRLILDRVEDAFRSANMPFALNVENIKKAGDDKFEEKKNEIKRIFKNRPFSIQIDMCKCDDRNVLGIAGQFSENGKIVSHTLGMKRLFCRATGINIAHLILKVLDELDLSLQNVVSITSDNGANMLLAAKILKAYQKNSLDDLIERDVEQDDVDVFLQMVQRSAQQIENDCCDLMEHIRCSNHSIDLGFDDAMKKCDADQKIINDSRELVKHLRTPTVANLLEQLGHKKALIDIPTRWNSEFKMLVRLLELKEFCLQSTEKEYERCKLSLDEWKRVAEIVDILKPLAEKVTIFQGEEITLSEVYAQWKDVILHFEEMEVMYPEESLVGALLCELKNRFEPIANNRMVLSSVYLDPRFQLLLNEEEKNVAKVYLTQLYMCYFRNTNIEVNTHSTSGELSTLEKLLRQKEAESTQTCNQNCLQTTIREKVSNFDGVQRSDIKENVLMFWEKNKITHPVLHVLAEIVLSVPGTETKIERNFSGLKFVLNRLRTNLGDNELEKILFVRLNKDKQ